MLTMHVKGDSFILVTHVRVGNCEEKRAGAETPGELRMRGRRMEEHTQPRRSAHALRPVPRDPDNLEYRASLPQ